MSDSDQSLTNLRYNQVTQGLEGFGGGTPQWTPLVLVADGGINQLTGDVTAGPGAGSQAASISSTTVTGKLLTGYSSGAGTVASTDTILQGINKLNGNAAAISAVANAALPSASFTDTAVTGKLLTGYSSGAGTVAGTDTILQGINKLNGNDALKLPLAGGTLTGALTINPATNQLILGGVSAGKKVTISCAAPASADRVYTIPDQGADANIVGDKAAYTMAATQTYSKAQVLNVATPAGTGTVTPDATLGPTFEITVSGALTLNGPSSPVNGQKVTLMIHNDASHSVTLATGSGNFAFGTDITSYTNSVSLTDFIGVIYSSAASRWYVVSVIQGF